VVQPPMLIEHLSGDWTRRVASAVDE
jgi:hypothetical protein